MNLFNLGFNIQLVGSVFVAISAILILALVVIKILRRIRDERSPELTAPATVTAKRVEVVHHHNPVAGDATGAHGFYITTSTNYFVTFRLDGGEVKELQVSEAEYALMIEGDRGRLHYQGAIYRGFERTAL
jgi:hypothetical protein